MKEDLPYFSHDNDARNHAKMKALRARFGWTGYGQFWALNEMIAGSAHACLDLSRKVVRAGAACELGMTTDALESFLSFLADPDECGLIDYDEGIVTTDRTQEDYGRTEAGRVQARTRYETKKPTSHEKDKTSHEKDTFTPCETIENRVEENREEEREDNTTAPFVAEAPEPSKAVIVKPKQTALYHAIRQCFLAKTPTFANYAKEAQAIKRIEAFAGRYSPDDRESATLSLIAKYWELVQSQDKFWHKQPFTPAGLGSLMDRVARELEINRPQTREEYEDAYAAAREVPF